MTGCLPNNSVKREHGGRVTWGRGKEVWHIKAFILLPSPFRGKNRRKQNKQKLKILNIVKPLLGTQGGVPPNQAEPFYKKSLQVFEHVPTGVVALIEVVRLKGLSH